MENCANIALALNPRYINSGFLSQANNIAASKKTAERQLACIMSAISSHVLKYGHSCYASDQRLLFLYNQKAASFGVRVISPRTLTSRIKAAEQKGLIKRDYANNQETGQTLRLITLVLDGISRMFKGVYNYASRCADQHHKRENNQKLRSARYDLNNSPEPSNANAQSEMVKSESCEQRSKISLKRESNRNNGQPSDSFYVRFFKQDANVTKELQLAAREKRLTASGARKLIAIHAKHGFELAKSFKKYLHSILAREHSEAKWISGIEQNVYGGSAQEALREANAHHLEVCRESIEKGLVIPFYDLNGRVHTRAYHETLPTDEHVALGRAIHVRSLATGRVCLEWLHHDLWPTV